MTWFIMITKFFDQRRLRIQAIEAEKEFWSSSSLTDAISKLKGGSNPFRALAETGKQPMNTTSPIRAVCRAPSAPANGSPNHCSALPDAIISRMQTGLPVLASVGATAPFVGLLGT